MKKILGLVTLFLFTGFVYAQKVNDPNAQLREVKGFQGIDVSSAFDVYLSQGNEDVVAVSAANDKTRDQIITEVRNGVLHIGFKGKGWKLNKDQKLKAYITFRAIDRLYISGACDVFLSGTLKAEALSIRQSGASDLKEGRLEVGKLTVDLSGASDMRVSGKAKQVSVEASGASSFRGFDLVTEICDVRASGASDIRITVNKELSAQANGASDIRYRGEGVMRDVKSSGSSSVSKG